MAKYKIKYNYNTGNSFGIETGLENFLELEWNDEDVAKKNLQRIGEHYTQYKSLDSYFTKNKTAAEIFDDNKDKDWFVKKYEKIRNSDEEQISVYEAKHLIILYSDEGNQFQIYAPWCGYFESLNFAEIVEDKSDRRISFE